MNSPTPSKAALEFAKVVCWLDSYNVDDIARLFDTALAEEQKGLREAAQELIKAVEWQWNLDIKDSEVVGNAIHRLRTALAGSGVVTPKNDALRDAAQRTLDYIESLSHCGNCGIRVCLQCALRTALQSSVGTKGDAGQSTIGSEKLRTALEKIAAAELSKEACWKLAGAALEQERI